MRTIRYLAVALTVVVIAAGCGSSKSSQQKSAPKKSDVHRPQQGSSRTGTVWVANEDAGSLSAIDTRTNTVRTTITGIEGPHNVQADPANHLVWAVSAHDGQLIAWDSRTLELKGVIPTGSHPAHVIVFADGASAAVTNSEDNTVSMIDVESMRVVKTIKVGAMPHGMRPSHDSKQLLLAHMGGTSVGLIDVAKGAESATIEVGKTPVQVALDSASKFGYVSLNAENAVAQFDLSTRKTVRTVDVGTGPAQIYLTADDTTLLVANQGTEEKPSDTVTVLRAPELATSATITVGKGAHGVVADPSSRYAYVTNMFDDTVSVIDLKTMKVMGDTIAVGDTPNGISFTPDTIAAAQPKQVSLENAIKKHSGAAHTESMSDHMDMG